MSGISHSKLIEDGIDPAAYFYADRILAGLVEMPTSTDADTKKAIAYLRGENMARTPKKPAEIHAEPGPLPESHAITLAEHAELKALEQDQFAMVMQDIGAMRALSFIRKISGRAQVELYLKLKETKAWKSVPHPDGRKFSDLDELCDVYLGETGRSIRNKIPNYHLLGPELYEVSERMGFKPRDYTAIKALPAEDQEVIKQAMQADDRNQVIDLLQEMAARHASEKIALTAEAAEAKETAEARDQVVKAKETKITQLEEANNKLKRRIQKMTPDEVGVQLREEVGQFAFAAEAEILGNLRAGFQALAEHAEANGVTHENFMSGCLAQIESALLTIRNEFHVKAAPDADDRPGWVDDGRDPDEIVAGELGEQIAGFNARTQRTQ